MAGLEIDPSANRARNGHRHTRAQSFLNGPKGLPLITCFDQDHTAWIKAKTVKSMAVRVAVISKPTGRGNEQNRPALRHAIEKSHNEAESRRDVPCRLGHDFMHGLQGKTALRQISVEIGKT